MAAKTVKHEGMKNTNACPRNSDYLTAPAYPQSGPQIFNRLRMALTAAFSRLPTLPEFARLTGHPRATVQHWLHAFRHPHVVFFLCLLEQLPEKERGEIVAKLCRELPLIDHPRLAHDPLAIGALENVIHKNNGITWVRGTDVTRTFLATALCHSALRSFPQRVSICGLDAHQPNHFVPVQGITYINEPLSPTRIHKVVTDAWPAVVSSTAQIIMLNGIWSCVPSVRNSILKLAEGRHVIIADVASPDSADIKRRAIPTNVITLTASKEREAWIQANVTAL